MRLILASASPARLRVLRQAGIEPLVHVAGIDEEALTAELSPADPGYIVTALAHAKATAVADDLHADELHEAVPDRAVIVGCDSLLHLDGELIGKPGTTERARQRWQRLAGATGELFTGHAVLRTDDGATARAHSACSVRFGRPTESELESYLATGEPLAVAGAFTIGGYGGWFVDGIDGDPSTVIGISLPLLRRLLADVGVDVTALWS